MTEFTNVLRVHPAIGFARVGNSENYYLGPETAAGLPLEGKEYTGGIPLNAKTGEPIKSSEIRDSEGRLVRQAARFKIFRYPSNPHEQYPNGGGEEVTIGSKLDGKTVTDIIWTVHVANKKANAYVLENPLIGDRDLLIHGYQDGQLPPLRNASGFPIDPNNIERLRTLVIDPGPRAIRDSTAYVVSFNQEEPASFYDEHCRDIRTITNYPKSFPSPNLYNPWGEINTLGELRTDESGRLIVTGGYGRGSSLLKGGGSHGPNAVPDNVDTPSQPYPLNAAVDNDGWFDDTSDGPVDAIVLFDDGSTLQAHGAWVNTTDPAYAPQTLNVVSLWDDIYDTWIRQLDLCPDIYSGGKFNPDFKPSFPDQIQPFFIAAALQRWNTNLPVFAIKAHDAVGRISADDPPKKTIMAELAFVRNPNITGQSYMGAPLMPLSLGDNGKSFLSPSITQYYLLTQWNSEKFDSQPLKLGVGERLDRDVLLNCLGGRFSPGIDMTFIVREPDLYVKDWRNVGCGPFRIRREVLDYGKVQSDRPFLTEGYVPLRPSCGLQPGDGSKFMSVPWHTDYNSCATHNTAPNPASISQPASSTLYWSWPAQRPVAVYTADDARFGQLGNQRFSVRGPGTGTKDPAQKGRFQQYIDFLINWPDVGVVIQATQIDNIQNGKFEKDWYLEVESRLENIDSEVGPWPINSINAAAN